ncbi:MAG: DUF2497 domain-containing protein [Ehrlichia sp.]
MSNTNNFNSLKEVIANIRKVMCNTDNTDSVMEQSDTDSEVLSLENPENAVELHNIQHVHNTLDEINQTFQSIADLPTPTHMQPICQNKTQPDIQASTVKENIYSPDKVSTMNQFIAIEQSTQRVSSQERRLTTTTLSEEVSKIDNASEIKGIHQQSSFISDNLLSPENIVANSEEIKKLITQIHRYTEIPTEQKKSNNRRISNKHVETRIIDMA